MYERQSKETRCCRVNQFDELGLNVGGRQIFGMDDVPLDFPGNYYLFWNSVNVDVGKGYTICGVTLLSSAAQLLLPTSLEFSTVSPFTLSICYCIAGSSKACWKLGRGADNQHGCGRTAIAIDTSFVSICNPIASSLGPAGLQASVKTNFNPSVLFSPIPSFSFL